MARKSELSRFAGFCSNLILPSKAKMRLEPFQRKMLCDYFAGVSELAILVPKKNGKTSLLAALSLYHLLDTDDADCVVVANSSLQAMKLFDEARGFIQRARDANPAWEAEREEGKIEVPQLRVLRGYREIRRPDPDQPEKPKEFRGVIKVIAADADTADGWGGTLALIDELHRQKSGDLYGVLRDGLGPRAGQLITISTAGETEDSPLGELRSRAYDIPGMKRQGAYRYVTNGAFSMHEWALEPDEDREDLKVVKRANPASWQTISELRRRKESPSMTPWQWARFAGGVWGLGGEPAFSRDVWDSLASGEGQPAHGRKIVLGFDGARRRDGTALVGCDIETGHLFMLGYWQKPAGADGEWEVPEHEVDQLVEYAFSDAWDVIALYGDPPYWESALDRWAGHWGRERVVRWWTNHIKKTAIALRAFRNDMEPGRMSHDGDEKLTEHIHNAIRKDTRMVEDDLPLWTIQKDSKDSHRKIDAAMAAMLAWKARGDVIAKGALDQPDYETASWSGAWG